MVSAAGGRILVVDDHEASRFARVRTLAEAGHTIFEAARLDQAEVLLREVRPEVIVLDVNLPDGNGLDFCRRIKEDDDFRAVMVLHMSASFTTSEDQVRGLEAGADGYLTDPVSPGVLLATTDALLRLSRAERALKDMLSREQAARAEAESANRLKDDFLATLSHELRTPLNAIIGWTTLMRTISMDDEARRKAIDTIERNAKSQAALIEDLLDVSRITQGQLRLTWLPVHLPAIVAAAVDTIRPSADGKGLTLVADLTVDPRLSVQGDPVRLQQVVWNLLSNAVKFTPQGGRVEAALTLHANDVQLRVSDNGRGIKPDFMPLIFDRFRRADVSMTAAGSGLGLGLAIARQLVEMHGGTLMATSEGENKGTTFIVRLPRMSGDAAPRREVRPATSQGAKENVIP
jgi:signal transduction histidine kinase